MKILKRSDYIQIVKPTYKYLKIIPNTGVRNYKSDEIASYVNNMYRNLRQRIVKNEKKLIVKSNCKLTYYIHITKSDVQFFFIVPEYHLNMIKQKINNVWSSKVTFEEVDDIPRFKDSASKMQMVYKNLDSLSINADRRTNDLLASEFTIIDNMTEGDSVGILYNFIPLTNRDRKVWFTHFEEDMIKYKKNKSLEKITTDPVQLFWKTVLAAVNSLDVLIRDIQVAIGKKSQEIAILSEISNAIVDKKQLSSTTLKKKNDTIINTQIVTITQSEDKDQQNKLLDSVINSFDVIREDNELIGKPVKKNFEIEDYNYPVETIRCSDKEIGANFIALPGKEILREYKNITKVEINETEIPLELQEGIISLGKNQFKNTNKEAFLSNDESFSNLPVAILGGSRSGKSTYSINMCKNIIDAGEGLIIPDFIKNTEFADKIKAITPKERLIELDLSVPECLQAFSYNEIQITKDMKPIEIIKKSNMQIQQVMALVDAINNDGSPLTSKMRRFLHNAGKIVFIKNESSLKDVIKCLQNHVYRAECVESIPEELKPFLDEAISTMNELNEYDKKTDAVVGTKESKIEGIIDRINLLKENINMDIMFNLSSKNNIDFVKAMNERKVVLIRLREDEYFDSLSKNVLITFFISKIWLATQIRGKQKNIPRCTVLIDEVFQTPMAQRLIGKQLVQSAKFGLKYVFTLHYLNQLYPDVQESLKNANASYMLLAGTDKKAFNELKEEFVIFGYEVDDLINLKRYHSLNLIKIEKAYSAFITKLPPPV